MSTMEKLKKAADEAYAKYPNSCSHSVWHVIKEYIPEQPYNVANGLLIQLECDPGWKLIRVDEIEKLVNAGTLIVGGAAGAKNGHVIVAYPGKAKSPGGYMYTNKKSGKKAMLIKSGIYPLAMSTSIGSWPGSMSNGDKTVWDPWGNDESFSEVKFWRFDPDEKKKPASCK